MILYHLTNITHLVEIENDGFLEVTESNIGAPEVIDNQALPRMVPVYVPTTDGSLSINDPRHPDFQPLVVPREIYMAMHDRDEAPPMLDMDAFRTAVEPLSRVVDDSGEVSVPVSVVVGYQPDGKIVTTTSETAEELTNATKMLREDLAAVKYGDHVGPDVVWLTDDPTPTQDWQAVEKGGIPFMFRKNVVLFTVEVPDEDVRRWDEWAHEQGILQFWYDALDGGTGDSKHWYVLPRRLLKSEWVSIHNTETGSLYWDRDLGHVEGEDRFAIPMPAVWYATSLFQEHQEL